MDKGNRAGAFTVGMLSFMLNAALTVVVGLKIEAGMFLLTLPIVIGAIIFGLCMTDY